MTDTPPNTTSDSDTLDKVADNSYSEGNGVDETLGIAGANTICPNCETPLQGPFCHNCGQNQRAVDRFFLALVAESLEDIFSLDSKVAKTIVPLLFRPGYLTREYFRGRRARYVQPLRLYFITSVLFFFVLSVANQFNTADEWLQINNNNESSDQTEVIAEAETPEAIELKEARKEFRVDELDLEFFADGKNEALKQRIEAQFDKAEAMFGNDTSALSEAILDIAPPIMFVLLPLFAFLLKLVYLGSGRYYTQHLVLAVHNHCFIYIALMLDNLIEILPLGTSVVEFLQLPLNWWMGIYLFLSLKITYEQGWFITGFKFLILTILYTVLFVVASMFGLLVGVMTL